MKRLILLLLLEASFASFSFSGNPRLLKEVKTALGTKNTRPIGIYEKNSNILVCGYAITSSDPDPLKQVGFLACFDSSLALKWKFFDSISVRPIVFSSIPLSKGGYVAASINSEGTPLTTLFFLNEMGAFVKKVVLPDHVIISRAGEDIIAVTVGSNATVYTISENGTIKSQWKTVYSHDFRMAIKTLGAFVWIYSDSYEGVHVEKYNYLTGTFVWRRLIPDGNLAWGDLDNSGNSYFGLTRIVPNPGAPGFTTANQWHLEKIDSGGNIIWDTEWFSRETWVGRVNAATTTVSINTAKNLVVIGGEMQGSETIADGARINYLAGFSMDSGKISWEKKWAYSPTTRVSGVYGTCFTAKGDLLVLGYEVVSSGFTPPNPLHLEKYAVDNVTGVKETTLPTIPEVFALSQNYPNPFNPSTVIRYAVPHISEVSLIVYDALGREVETLVRDVKNAGEYEVRFTASSLPSGIYFYRLQTADRTETKKMILLK
ncbi:MAG: T9SS type A sorting domain-containing protein [Candidatus Paceibacterota bacterium]|jgi:hypothetical protein